MRVLVTGAAGRIGRNVVRVLDEAGFDVRATDQRYDRDCPVAQEAADLRDRLSVYRLVEGCDAVVHLGNHPGMQGDKTPQQIYADNVTMNANVLMAATEVGVERLIYASSIQVICGRR